MGKVISTPIRIQKIGAGALFGIGFGVFFGAVASLFQGGPGLLQGIKESTPWFSILGTIAGFLLALEKDE